MAEQFPTSPAPASAKVRVTQPAYVSRAEDMTQQAVTQGAHSVGATLTWPPMQRAQAGPLLGFAAGRKGQALPFELQLPGLSNPAGLGVAATVSGVTNMVRQSERVTLLPWSRSAESVVSAGPVGPDGMRDSQLFEVTTAGTAWSRAYQDLPAVTGGQLVVQARVKEATAVRFSVSLYNPTAEQHHNITWEWVAGAPVLQSSNNVDSWGAVSLGDGWWRVWHMVDRSARGLDTGWRVYIYPRVSPTVSQAGTYLAGVQVEQGVAAPSDYLWTRDLVEVRPAGCRVVHRQNLVPDSEDLEELADIITAATVSGYGASAPAGITHAPPVLLLATGDAGGRLRTGYLTTGQRDTVASVYVAAPAYCGRVGLNIEDGTAGVSHYMEVDDLATAAPSVHHVADLDGFGVEAVAGWPGWWRLWIHLDGVNRSLSGHDLRVYLYPDRQDRAGYGAWFHGLQLEHGRQRPGPYLPTSGGAVTSQAPGGNLLHVDGLEAGAEGVLIGNDYFKLDGHTKLYQVTEQVDADAHGVAAIKMVPMLRQVPTAGELVQLEDVPLTCTFTSPVQEYTTDKPELFGYSAEVEEYQA